MLCTLRHGRDTFRVPIGDVLIKCCIIEHCENERVGKEFVSIQQFIFCWWRFFKLEKKRKKRKKNEKKNDKKNKRQMTINNNKKREWVKREMLCTVSHVRDTSRVPIGDVLIKWCFWCEHCENERVGERVCIHSNNPFLLKKIF